MCAAAAKTATCSSSAIRLARSIAKFAIEIARTSGFAPDKKVTAPIILPPLKDAGFDLIGRS
ncbi:hypothetical protein IVA79_10310 [Bradyrhizobium sp. 138]|uniref:hypothetical protein n=1 Tax=Bradyrhizobium sp. 138 TaxID=2782615 RepID=UPI001FFACB4D|nr:hypothetical protein [Bradyrhizobium sp. 138]MCK1734338.1 hypothetical protein [Bradyrhizobium sp. 138]